MPGPATTPCSSACGRTRSRRWPGSTTTATSTATASSSTSGARGSACSTRAGRIRATRSGTSTARPAEAPIALAEVQGYVYAARRVDGPSGPSPRGHGARRAPRRGRRHAAQARFDAAFWLDDVGFYAMALDGAQAAGREHRLERRPGAVDRDRPGVPRRPGRRPAAGAGHVLGLGDPHLRRRPAGLQPGRLSHRLDLAARQRAHRGRASSRSARPTART